MKIKISLYGVIIDIVLWLSFQFLFFILFRVPTLPSMWITYGFMNVALLSPLLTLFLVWKCKLAVSRLSVQGLSAAYLVAETITGVTILFILPLNYVIPLCVQFLLLIVFVLLLISSLGVNKQTEIHMNQQQEEHLYRKNAIFTLESILKHMTNSAEKQAVEKLYDIIHASPAKSRYDTLKIETQIMNSIQQLTTAPSDYIAQVNQIILLAEERNLILRKKIEF